VARTTSSMARWSAILMAVAALTGIGVLLLPYASHGRWLAALAQPAGSPQGKALVRAASKGNLKAVQDLLDHGAPVNATDSLGETALMAASSGGQTAVAQLLLSRGADVNAGDKYGETALMNAAGLGHLKVVKLLLAHGADLNAQGHGPLLSLTALMSAASEGHTTVVGALLDAGADPNLHNQTWAMTALAYAVRGDHVDTTRTLIAHGADVNATSNSGFGPSWTTGDTVLMDAAQRGNMEAVHLLLADGAKVNAHDSKGQTALSLAEAAHPRNPAVIQLLIQAGGKGASLSPQGALVDAAKRGDLNAVKAWLDRGVPIGGLNSSGASALGEAAESGRTAVVQLLLSRGADPEAWDQFLAGTALAHAAAGGSATVARILLAHGARVDERTGSGRLPDVTPLMLAASNGNVEVAKLLIARRADVNAHDKDGLTALMACASKEGSAEFVRLLLAHGAKVDARNRYGSTSLLGAAEFALKPDASSALAAGRGYTAVAEALLEGGADPNVHDKSGGYTALHWAARHRQLGMMQSLIAHGADVNAKTPRGYTVLMMAVPGGSPEVVKLLLDHGADVNAQDHERGRTFTALKTARQREEEATKDPPRSRSFPTAADYAAIVHLLEQAGAKA
jgi:ankyrin repeat protein